MSFVRRSASVFVVLVEDPPPARAGGQINAVARMTDPRGYAEILVRIAAAQSALTHVPLALVEEHRINCATRRTEGNSDEAIRRVFWALGAALQGA